jgi:hypothetical protein
MKMSNWEMGSKPYSDGTRDVLINFLTDDTTGAIQGMLRFKGMVFTVHGNWAASGSVPGRNVSSFALWGSDSAAATDYVAATGTMKGAGNNPQSIALNLLRVESGSGQQYGWDGQLLPVSQN